MLSLSLSLSLSPSLSLPLARSLHCSQHGSGRRRPVQLNTRLRSHMPAQVATRRAACPNIGPHVMCVCVCVRVCVCVCACMYVCMPHWLWRGICPNTDRDLTLSLPLAHTDVRALPRPHTCPPLEVPRQWFPLHNPSHQCRPPRCCPPQPTNTKTYTHKRTHTTQIHTSVCTTHRQTTRRMCMFAPTPPLR